MNIRKYFQENKDIAVFVVKGVGLDNVRNRALAFTIYTGAFTSPPIWDMKIEASNNNIIFFTKLLSGVGNISVNQDILLNGVKTVASTTIITTTIYNPSVITNLKSADLEQNWSTKTVSPVSSDGVGKMISLTALNWNANATPENLFNLVNLLTLQWSSPDIMNWDDRFGLGGLVNLTSFTLSFPYSNANPTHNITLIKKFPNLTFLSYVGAQTTNSENVVNNFDFPFDSAFNYPITDYDLDMYGPPYNNMLQGIPLNIKYLRNLQNFSFQTGTTSPFDFTYPLIGGANNTVLQTIVASGNCRVNTITFPTNIEKLIALTNIHIGWANRNGSNNVNQNQVLLDFYDMFYSKIYNETNAANAGYTVSQTSRASGYFSTITPAVGFVHPTFRNCTLNATNGIFDIVNKPKADEIIATGFNLTAYF